MIFVCVGSREYQFNRLLKKIDELIEEGLITEPVFAQIGQSDYLPKYYKYKRFLSVDEFKKCQEETDIIISHGGTGALVGALKLGKKVIAVPRLAKYGEHIDDHQIQISTVLENEGYLKTVLDTDQLFNVIEELKSYPISRKFENNSQVLNLIKNFISNL